MSQKLWHTINDSKNTIFTCFCQRTGNELLEQVEETVLGGTEDIDSNDVDGADLGDLVSGGD